MWPKGWPLNSQESTPSLQGIRVAFQLASSPQQWFLIIAAVKQNYCCGTSSCYLGGGKRHECELDSLKFRSNSRPGITPASCVMVYNRYIFLRHVLWGDGKTALWAKSCMHRHLYKG